MFAFSQSCYIIEFKHINMTYMQKSIFLEIKIIWSWFLGFKSYKIISIFNFIE